MLSAVLPERPTPIAACELVQVSLPLTRPLRSSHGEETDRSVVLVRVVDGDGVEGWGECSALARPTYTHEYSDGAWRVLRDELVPAKLAGELPAVTTHPMAAAAVADACLDLELRRAGVAVVDALGVERRPLERTAVVGRTPAGGLTDAVAERIESGAAAVKLKVGPGDAASSLEQVRSRWPSAVVAADANGSLDEAAARAVGWDDLGVAYLEQPFRAGDLLASARLARSMETPVALDESAVDSDVLALAVTVGACSVVNVKPARVGGVESALAMVDRLGTWGIAWFVGGMLETGVGRSAALAVASLRGTTLPTDLGPSSAYFADDITEPVEVDASGRVVVPEAVGLCLHPRPGRLEEVAVRREVLR